jgi:hypothetical protein
LPFPPFWLRTFSSSETEAAFCADSVWDRKDPSPQPAGANGFLNMSGIHEAGGAQDTHKARNA